MSVSASYIGSAGSMPDTETTKDLVVTRFGMSEDLVSTYDAESSSAIDALADLNWDIPMGNLTLFTEDPVAPNIGEPPTPDAVAPYESQAQDVTFPDIAALRGLLDLVDVTIEQVTLPVLSALEPTVNIPTAPDDTIPDVPTNVPDITDPDLPPVPTIDLPTVPTLDEIILPAAPTIDNLVFEGTYPTTDLTVPEPMFVYSEGTYQSDLADAVNTKLYNDVVNGGTGLDADVEQAIWDRAADRLDIELAAKYDQVLENFEAWNCDMPEGFLSGALQEVAFEDTRNKTDLNNDILIAQGKLAQENTQFAITNGLVYEKQIMDYTNQVNQRAFEVARYRVQSVIDVFTIKVTAYNAELEGYRTLAQVFESRIRAELAKVEIYRAQMEGAKIHGDLQEQKVRIYTARVEALNTLIALYRAQMEGARLQVDVNKAKLDVFRARIDATIAQIQGVTASFNLYQAQIAGETAKVELYGKQVDAYGTQVQAAKTEADINLAEAQTTIESNKDKVAVLTAAIERYKSDVQYELGKDETGSRVYAAQIGGYEAEVGREGEYLKAQVDSYRAQVSEAVGRAELIIKEMDANLRAAVAALELQAEALKAAAGFQTQKAASALTSVSASAQLGFSAQEGYNYSQSEQRVGSSSTSYTDGYQETHFHTYDETAA